MTTDSQKWLLVAMLIGGGSLFLIYLLAPILTPFLVGGLLAYLGNPLVDRLERWKLQRTLAVLVVFTVLSAAIILTPLVLLPELEIEADAFVRALPEHVEWITQEVLPWLENRFGVDPSVFHMEQIKQIIAIHWKEAGGIVAQVVAYASKSGIAFVAWIGSLVLSLFVAFYMLRDWHAFLAGIRELLPRSIEPTVMTLAHESDARLSAFLRGQLLVMLCLAGIYSVGLWIIGLDLALLVGLLAGLVNFMPYFGVIIGVLVAGIAILLQTHDFMQLIPVFVIFGIGQLLEGMVLMPLLVGDRIGLHPVGVIFAVLAGGLLFGFFGILLALPVAAVLAVLVRRARQNYLASTFYRSSDEEKDKHTKTE